MKTISWRAGWKHQIAGPIIAPGWTGRRGSDWTRVLARANRIRWRNFYWNDTRLSPHMGRCAAFSASGIRRGRKRQWSYRWEMIR